MALPLHCIDHNSIIFAYTWIDPINDWSNLICSYQIKYYLITNYVNSISPDIHLKKVFFTAPTTTGQ